MKDYIERIEEIWDAKWQKMQEEKLIEAKWENWKGDITGDKEKFIEDHTKNKAEGYIERIEATKEQKEASLNSDHHDCGCIII